MNRANSRLVLLALHKAFDGKLNVYEGEEVIVNSSSVGNEIFTEFAKNNFIDFERIGDNHYKILL